MFVSYCAFCKASSAASRTPEDLLSLLALSGDNETWAKTPGTIISELTVLFKVADAEDAGGVGGGVGGALGGGVSDSVSFAKVTLILFVPTLTGDGGLGDAGVGLGDAGVGLGVGFGDDGVASDAATCSIKAFCKASSATCCRTGGNGGGDAGAAETEAFLKAGVVAGGGDVVAFFKAGAATGGAFDVVDVCQSLSDWSAQRPVEDQPP